MAEHLKTCPKCGTEMREVDGTFAILNFLPRDWQRNPPTSPVIPKNAFQIQVYRCPECLFVELWAAE